MLIYFSVRACIMHTAQCLGLIIDINKIQIYFKSRLLVHNNHEAEAQRSYAHTALNDKAEREHTHNSFGPLPHGYCERKHIKYYYF